MLWAGRGKAVAGSGKLLLAGERRRPPYQSVGCIALDVRLIGASTTLHILRRIVHSTARDSRQTDRQTTLPSAQHQATTATATAPRTQRLFHNPSSDAAPHALHNPSLSNLSTLDFLSVRLPRHARRLPLTSQLSFGLAAHFPSSVTTTLYTLSLYTFTMSASTMAPSTLFSQQQQQQQREQQQQQQQQQRRCRACPFCASQSEHEPGVSPPNPGA